MVYRSKCRFDSSISEPVRKLLCKLQRCRSSRLRLVNAAPQYGEIREFGKGGRPADSTVPARLHLRLQAVWPRSHALNLEP